MRNINNPDTRKIIYDRIALLKSDTKNKWGKMNVNQMLSHLTDALKMQLGELEVKDRGSSFSHTILKWVELSGMPPPKNMATFPEIDQVAKGVNPVDFKQGVETLIYTIRRSLEIDKPYFHPLFGKITVSQLGRLNYTHINHHLKQFGV